MIKTVDPAEAKTLGEAKTVMAQIASVTAALAVADARSEQRILNEKTRHEEATAAKRETLAELRDSLTSFIRKNKALFTKPRKVSTEYGTFGLQKVSTVVVTDENELIEAIEAKVAGAVAKNDERREWLLRSCISIKKSIAKKALRAAINKLAREKFAGCILDESDTPVIDVSSTYINNKKQEGDHA